MTIIVCGINHKTASVALREQLVFSLEKLPLYINSLLADSRHREAVLLSTCNRSEVYCDTLEPNAVLDWFYEQHPDARDALASSIYLYQDEQAVEHILSVACGLDSMVLGESQIVAQMKEAFSESCAAGGVGTLFNRLFQHVFAIAKEVRRTTSLGACPVSVSSAVVNFIKQHYPADLAAANVLLIGAGDTIDLVLRYLAPLRIATLHIANRSDEKAKLLAGAYAGQAVPWSGLPTVLAEADVVISATSSPHPIVTKAMLAGRKKPLFIIDIAVPRDVESAAAALPDVQLYSIDDLRIIIEQNKQGREHAAEKAREKVKIKSREFMVWLQSLDQVAATIRTYRQQIENLMQVELAKSIKRLQRGDNATDVLTSFAYALTNKILHAPSVQLRQAGVEGRFEVLQLAQQLLDIPLPEALLP